MIKIKDYKASWCAPCRQLTPILHELKEELGFELEEIDIEENEDEAITAGVRNIPTLDIFKDGEKVDRIVGALSKEALKNRILNL
jgi:thioredoxin 1